MTLTREEGLVCRACLAEREGRGHAETGGFMSLLAAVVLLAAALLFVSPVAAWGADSGLVCQDGVYRYLKNGTPVTSAWKTVKGDCYYFDGEGCAVTGSRNIEGTYYIFNDKGKLLRPSKSKICQLKSGVYYVNAKGCPAGSGWCIVDGKLYKVAKSGKCVTGKTVDGITLTKTGAAKNNTASQLKMVVMKKLDQLTKPGMTKKQKLRACFNYCLTRTFAISTLPKDIGKEGWVQRCALATLKSGKTQCYGFSCSFAAFAYELGYKPTVREARRVHAWVMIGGKAYDNMGPRFGGSSQRFGNEKNWKFVSWGGTSPKGEKATEKISSKKGLVKEGSTYVFYQNGKKIKKQWKTVKGVRYYFKSDGTAAVGPVKIGGKRYVFSAKGALLTGSKTRTVKVSGDTYRVTAKGLAKSGWTTSKRGLYLENGRAAKGLCCYKGNLYWFSASGVYDKAKTVALRKAAKRESDGAALLELVGEPLRSRTTPSCHPLTAVYDGGSDVLLTFKNALLTFFKTPDGTMIYLGCE